MSTAEQVYAYLDSLGIAYDTLTHPEVHTIGDSAPVDEALHSLTAKNYFLCTKNKKNFYLCLVRPNVRFHTADISKQVGSARLSFADADSMARLLRVYPGAVSPMGLIFDAGHRVRLIVDRGLTEYERLTFHPCENTQSLAMGTGDFLNVFLPSLGVTPLYVEIHDFTEGESLSGQH